MASSAQLLPMDSTAMITSAATRSDQACIV